MAKKKEEKEYKVIGDAKELTYIIPDHSYSSTWSTPEAFSRHIEELDAKKAWSNSAWSDSNKSFYGTKTMPEALKLAQAGWPEGTNMVERLRSGILAANPLLAKPIKYGVVGAISNVPRAVSGNPLNMKAIDLAKSRRRPVITLLSNMSANCGIASEAISNRAAVVAAVIDQIETAGYSCEVISTAMTKGYGSSYNAATTVILKEAGQPADTGRLAYGLGHASMFRRLVFADWQSEPGCRNGLGENLGHEGGLSDKAMKELSEKNIFCIPSAEEKSELFENEETAMKEGLAYIIKVLSKLGCPAFPGHKEEEKEKEVRP